VVSLIKYLVLFSCRYLSHNLIEEIEDGSFTSTVVERLYVLLMCNFVTSCVCIVTWIIIICLHYQMTV